MGSSWKSDSHSWWHWGFRGRAVLRKNLCPRGLQHGVVWNCLERLYINLFLTFYYVDFQTLVKIESKTQWTPMFSSLNFNCYQLMANLVSSTPYHSLHLPHYFEVNPGHNNISFINISFWISKRQGFHFKNKTSILSPHREFWRIPNAWTLDQVSQNIWGWDSGTGSVTKSSQVILMVLACLVGRQKLSGQG